GRAWGAAGTRPGGGGGGACPPAAPPCPACRWSAVPELDDVAVAHDVVLALDPRLAGGTGGRDRARGDQVVVRHHLGLDEPALEIGVDHPGRLRRGGADGDLPSARLLRPGGQERGPT